MTRIACWILIATFTALSPLLGCQAEEEPSAPQAGSESHFLEACQASCGAGFDCLCGVCTQSCGGDAVCAELDAAAECVEVSSRSAESACADAGVAAFCDVPCATGAECASLGAGFACSGGFCREAVPTANGRIEVEDVCDFYVNDICLAGNGCYDFGYPSQEHCLANWDCAGRARFDAYLAEGRISYDPAAAYACHERLLADPCALGFFLVTPTLGEALARCDAITGQIEEGGACRGLDCQSGLQCNVTEGCFGVCEPPAPPLPTNQPEGGACVPTICIDVEPCGQCAAGLICFDEVCRQPWDVGVPCNESNQCLLDFWCDLTLGQCVRLAEAGEACSDFPLNEMAPPCAEGLWCNTVPFEVGVCEPIYGAGGLCTSDAGCLDALPCVPGNADDPVGRGRCAPAQADGSACNSDDDCVSAYCDLNVCKPKPGVGEACSRYCAEGLLCEAQVCLTERWLGEPCDALSTCVDSRCDGATCVRKLRLGEPCTVNEDCALSLCTDGVCAESPVCVE